MLQLVGMPTPAPSWGTPRWWCPGCRNYVSGQFSYCGRCWPQKTGRARSPSRRRSPSRSPAKSWVWKDGAWTQAVPALTTAESPELALKRSRVDKLTQEAAMLGRREDIQQAKLDKTHAERSRVLAELGDEEAAIAQLVAQTAQSAASALAVETTSGGDASWDAWRWDPQSGEWKEILDLPPAPLLSDPYEMTYEDFAATELEHGLIRFLGDVRDAPQVPAMAAERAAHQAAHLPSRTWCEECVVG